MDGRMDGWMDRRAGGQATLHETFFFFCLFPGLLKRQVGSSRYQLFLFVF